MSKWKRYLVVLTFALLIFSLPIFLVTGYTALYWAWIRANVEAALPFLPWARNFGMLAMMGAAAALVILFSSNTNTLPPRIRLWLSFLAAITIGMFSEFRNEGKFHLNGLVHVFGPGTWIHEQLNRFVPSLGDFLYRIEYSHWNDFLMGPAITSILFFLVFFKILGAFRNQGPISLIALSEKSNDLDQTLRFGRILMNVGLFWFFTQAWAEKAGYLRNPHSSDQLDLPFEFAGTMLGFWMARVLTQPFDQKSESFRSTFLIDFVASGLIGLLYTLIVVHLTESVASAVAHSLYPVVPGSLETPEYTSIQRYMRPLELLLLAGVMWWSLNHVRKQEQLTRLGGAHEEPEPNSRWDVLKTMAQPLAIVGGYLLILTAMLSVLEPQGVGWTLATLGIGTGVGTAALLLLKRSARARVTTVVGRGDD